MFPIKDTANIQIAVSFVYNITPIINCYNHLVFY